MSAVWLWPVLLLAQDPSGPQSHQPWPDVDSTLRLEITESRGIAVSRDVHYGFSRLVRAGNGKLLLFYRVGTTHAYDYSAITMRASADDGATWSAERVLHRDPDPRHSAHNPVALVTRGGRVLLWASSYGFQVKPRTRNRGYWASSDDDGWTWPEFRIFDTDPARSTYYITDAILTSDGMLAAGTTFPPGGAGNACTLIWHSSDDGRRWSVRSMLTKPDENLRDEVALMETKAGTILCLLRARRQPGADYFKAIYRCWSHDGGRTWSKLENTYSMLDCILQRPFLTRLDPATLLLPGRDLERKLVVACVSTDNGATFAYRRVVDHYNADGAYASAVRLSGSRALMTYYSDSGSAELKPDIKQVFLVPAWN